MMTLFWSFSEIMAWIVQGTMVETVYSKHPLSCGFTAKVVHWSILLTPYFLVFSSSKHSLKPAFRIDPSIQQIDILPTLSLFLVFQSLRIISEELFWRGVKTRFKWTRPRSSVISTPTVLVLEVGNWIRMGKYPVSVANFSHSRWNQVGDIDEFQSRRFGSLPRYVGWALRLIFPELTLLTVIFAGSLFSAVSLIRQISLKYRQSNQHLWYSGLILHTLAFLSNSFTLSVFSLYLQSSLMHS